MVQPLNLSYKPTFYILKQTAIELTFFVLELYINYHLKTSVYFFCFILDF